MCYKNLNDVRTFCLIKKKQLMFFLSILLCYNMGSNVIMNIWKFQKSISTSIPDKQNGASTAGQNLLAEKINFKVAAGTEVSASHLSRLSSFIRDSSMHRCQLRGFVPNPALYSTRLSDIARYVR